MVGEQMSEQINISKEIKMRIRFYKNEKVSFLTHEKSS